MEKKEEDIEIIDDEKEVKKEKKDDGKNKKLILIILTIVFLLIAALLLYLFVFNKDDSKPTPPPVAPAKEEVTITFDTDGGNKIDSVKVEKGKTYKLPEPVKEKYQFVGWYLDDKKVDDTTVFDKDVTLKAKWEEQTKEVKYYKVTFDSIGGSSVSSIKVECEKELKLPKRNYQKIETYTDSKGTIGLILHLIKGGGVAYFDVASNTLLINFLEYNFIDTEESLFEKGYLLLFNFLEKKYVLYDVDNNIKC